MDLSLAFKVIRHHKIIMVLAVISAIWLGLTASSQSYTTYKTSVKLILDRPDFSLGRVGISPYEQEAFYRTVALAKTYSYLITADNLLARIKKTHNLNGQISARNIKDVPIVQIFVSGEDKKQVLELAQAVATNFIAYIKEMQEEQGIPVNERVTVSVLGKPSPPIGSSRKKEIVFFSLLSPLLLGFLVSMVLENLKNPPATLVTAGQNENKPETLPPKIAQP